MSVPGIPSNVDHNRQETAPGEPHSDRTGSRDGNTYSAVLSQSVGSQGDGPAYAGRANQESIHTAGNVIEQYVDGGKGTSAAEGPGDLPEPIRRPSLPSRRDDTPLPARTPVNFSTVKRPGIGETETDDVGQQSRLTPHSPLPFARPPAGMRELFASGSRKDATVDAGVSLSRSDDSPNRPPSGIAGLFTHETTKPKPRGESSRIASLTESQSRPPRVAAPQNGSRQEPEGVIDASATAGTETFKFENESEPLAATSRPDETRNTPAAQRSVRTEQTAAEGDQILAAPVQATRSRGNAVRTESSGTDDAVPFTPGDSPGAKNAGASSAPRAEEFITPSRTPGVSPVVEAPRHDEAILPGDRNEEATAGRAVNAAHLPQSVEQETGDSRIEGTNIPVGARPPGSPIRHPSEDPGPTLHRRTAPPAGPTPPATRTVPQETAPGVLQVPKDATSTERSKPQTTGDVIKDIAKAAVHRSTNPLTGDDIGPLELRPAVASPTSAGESGQAVTELKPQPTVGDRIDLARRILDAVQISAQKSRPLRVRLHPPELGVLQVEITREQGSISARLEVETLAARQILAEHLAELKASLHRNGVTVERLDIQLADGRSGGRIREHFEQSPSSETWHHPSEHDERRRDDQSESPEDDEPADQHSDERTYTISPQTPDHIDVPV